MADTYWTFHVETGGGTETIVATSLDAETPTPASGTEVGAIANFAPDGRTTAYDERYRSLRAYGDVPGSAVVRYGTDSNGTPWFRERYGGDHPVESAIVGLEPGPDVADTRGVWAILLGLEDTSRPFAAGDGYRRLELELFVLGRFADYADHAAVRTALADTILG